MKKRWIGLIGAVLCTAILAGCAPSDPPIDPTAVTEPSVTDPKVTEPSITQPVVTAPSATVPVQQIPVPTEPAPTDPTPTEPAPTEPEEVLIDVDSDRLPCSQQALYRQLFDRNNKITVDIRMDEAELQKLQDDYDKYTSFGSKSPIYRKADVVITVDGVSYLIREVGVRMKGNTSRTSFYDTAKGGIYNAIHLKLDFQQTFDDEGYYGSSAQTWPNTELRKARKDRTFATLEELELRWNKSYDPSYIKESYAYELYRSEGVLSPQINLCSFDWSGIHMGVYTINEPVDEIFLEKHLSAQDLGGDLYKCSRRSDFTTTKFIGIEDEDKGEFYAYDLKTNKKTSDHSALKNLIQNLNDPDLTKEEFAQLVDVDNFLSYVAVSWFLGNPDDLRNNYNNFYIYFLKSSGKMIVIPYDLDQCFGSTTTYTMTEYDPFSDLAEYHKNKPAQTNPLYLNTVTRGSFFVEDYADVLDRVSQNGLLQPASFKLWFDRAKSLYSDDVTPSKTIQNMSNRALTFDMTKNTATNIPFDAYIGAIMDTYETYMKEFRSS